jgi:hypothetical protein
MACRACQNVSRLTLRHGARDLVDSYHVSSPSSSSIRTALRASSAPITTPIQTRRIHSSPINRQAEQKPPGKDDRFLARDLARQLAARASKSTQGTYAIYGASELIYKTCTSQAAYDITEKDREAGKIAFGPDGEEVGVGGGMWHDGLFPFSSV